MASNRTTKTTRMMQIERSRKRVQLRAELEKARERRDSAAEAMRKIRDKIKQS
jgi:hypothetical protein